MRDLTQADLRARILASEWHGGQWSPLYALASSGAITAGALGEIEAELTTAQGTDRADLMWLRDYVVHEGTRRPVRGWSTLHWEPGERGRPRTRDATPDGHPTDTRSKIGEALLASGIGIVGWQLIDHGPPLAIPLSLAVTGIFLMETSKGRPLLRPEARARRQRR